MNRSRACRLLLLVAVIGAVTLTATVHLHVASSFGTFYDQEKQRVNSFMQTYWSGAKTNDATQKSDSARPTTTKPVRKTPAASPPQATVDPSAPDNFINPNMKEMIWQTCNKNVFDARLEIQRRDAGNKNMQEVLARQKRNVKRFLQFCEKSDYLPRERLAAFVGRLRRLGNDDGKLSDDKKPLSFPAGVPSCMIDKLSLGYKRSWETFRTPHERPQPQREEMAKKLEKSYGKLAPNVRDLYYNERPLTAEEWRVWKMMTECNAGDGFGFGQLQFHNYPRATRFIARMLTNMPQLYDGTAGTAAGEEARRAQAEKAQEQRLEAFRSKWNREWKDKQLFISSIQFNSAGMLPYLISTLKQFLEFLGPKRVYVSIYENGSTDNTKALLGEFKKWLREKGADDSGVVMENERGQHGRNLGSPIQFDHKHELLQAHDRRPNDRIKYLADIRNRSFRPFDRLAGQGKKFDKVFVINDVFWYWKDAVDMLAANDMDYDMICGVDGHRYENYDVWTHRSATGKPFAMQHPFIRGVDERILDLARRGKPAPNYSCWGGMAIIDGEPFYSHKLRFRGNKEGECYGSECFFIARDLEKMGRKKRFVVTTLRTTYTVEGFMFNYAVMNRPIVRRFMEEFYDPDSDFFIKADHEAQFPKYDDGVACFLFAPWSPHVWPPACPTNAQVENSVLQA